MSKIAPLYTSKRVRFFVRRPGKMEPFVSHQTGPKGDTLKNDRPIKQPCKLHGRVLSNELDRATKRHQNENENTNVSTTFLTFAAIATAGKLRLLRWSCQIASAHTTHQSTQRLPFPSWSCHFYKVAHDSLKR